jgi:hypothetical protein
MGARVESEPTWSTADISGRVNILQKLPFILEYAGIPESCTVLHPRNIAAEDAGPASRQATYKNIASETMVQFGFRLAGIDFQRRFSPTDCGMLMIFGFPDLERTMRVQDAQGAMKTAPGTLGNMDEHIS